MSSAQNKKPEYSKKILKMLAERPALMGSDIERLGPQNALKRSLKALSEAGLVETHHSGQNAYIRLTNSGRFKARSQSLDASSSVLNLQWDGKWRIIMLDLPEERKSERDALRYLLKKAGFICMKNAVWISPYPYEYLFTNIKKDLGLSTEIMIFVTDTLDPETEKEFISTFSK